ncbi:MAG: polysaccharide deacetylase family protein [Coriobacteriia bacterium]|nr:polysaccharide deacetylase family protein [Coriobacteriia bacterium]
MSEAPNANGPSRRTSAGRILAVGLLLLTVAAVAGCQSVKAGSWRELGGPLGLSRRAGTADGAKATAPDGDEPEDPSDASVVATPAFAAVPPHDPQPTFDRSKYIGLPVEFVPNDQHEVALTFDDGPSRNSGAILSILETYDAHATFFMVAKRAEIHDDRVLAVVGADDEVANHTWSHSALRNLDATTTALQIDRAQAMLTAEAGTPPLFVRPRGGKFDEAGRMALVDRGLIMVLWSIHANDIEPSPTPDQIVKNATHHIKPGSIILMHETNDNTVLALPKILDELRAKGLRPVTLSQLLADGHP